jgi:hypothetical protein
VLNRLRGRPLDEPIDASRKLTELGLPALAALEQAVEDAERRSPELAQARATADAMARSMDLARKERYPDFALSAAVMPRGQLDPMWSLGLSLNLPIWSGSKQGRAVSETAERRAAIGHSVESVRQLLRLRTQERLALLDAALETTRLYRGGLLVQSESTASSTLAQYQVGRVPFAAVLEALGGWIADLGGYLDASAQAQRLAIAQAELSLEAPPGAESGMGGGAGGGAMSGGSAAGAMGGGGRAAPGMGGPTMGLPAGPSDAVGKGGAGGGAASGRGMGGGM